MGGDNWHIIVPTDGTYTIQWTIYDGSSQHSDFYLVGGNPHGFYSTSLPKILDKNKNKSKNEKSTGCPICPYEFELTHYPSEDMYMCKKCLHSFSGEKLETLRKESA